MNSIIQEFIIFCLGSKERLLEYIKNDVNLAKYTKEKYYYLIALAMKFISPRPELIEEAKLITPEKVLELLKAKRPDLYEVLITEEGKLWFQKQDFSQFFTLI